MLVFTRRQTLSPSHDCVFVSASSKSVHISVVLTTVSSSLIVATWRHTPTLICHGDTETDSRLRLRYMASRVAFPHSAVDAPATARLQSDSHSRV